MVAPVSEKFNQCINSVVFKYIYYYCPNYLNEVLQIAVENNIQTTHLLTYLAVLANLTPPNMPMYLIHKQ